MIPGAAVRSRAALRRELEQDAYRETENRRRTPRAIAVLALLGAALEHERAEPRTDRMPMPAFEKLEEMHANCSDAIRNGHEVSEHARDEVIAFLHEHVKNSGEFLRRLAARVGA